MNGSSSLHHCDSHRFQLRPNRASASKVNTLAILAAGLTSLLSQPAHAVNGCQVLLCFAAPSWRSVPQCVPPVTQVLRDLVRGKAFPACAMSGSTNSASNAWADAPSYCPPQYTHSYDTDNGLIYTCDYMGAVSLMVNGSLFARTWWTIDGNTSTEFTPSAKAQLASWDTRFDDDYAVWLNAHAPVASIDFNN